MLGHKLCQVLSAESATFATFRGSAPDRAPFYGRTEPIAQVDALEFESVSDALTRARPDVVVNAIGIVKQRSTATDPVLSISVNSLFPHRLAKLCDAAGARLVHFSTDCVFSGRGGAYVEADVPDPIDLYGRSKLLGEVDAPGVLTIRTSIIGRELENMTGLLEWFLGQAGGRVKGFSRVTWSGVTTNFLAQTVARLIREGAGLSGVFHLSGPAISKYQLLVWLNDAFGTRTTVERDDALVSDRSLLSDRFWSRTGFTRPDWPQMVSELALEARMYEGIANARR
jgi:dTDP-4-dehydrorhamnose reductase